MLLFLEKVPGDKTAFEKGVKAVSRKYKSGWLTKMNPNWLMALMNSETGSSFSASQKNLAGSGATGLIQFMPSTARQLGTTTTELAKMTNVEQLYWVDKYIDYTMKNVAKVDMIKDYDDLYLLIFYPKAVGKPDSFEIFKSGTTGYTQNKGMDMNGDGKITVSDFKQFIRKKIPKDKLGDFTHRIRHQNEILIGFGLLVIAVSAAWAFGYLDKWYTPNK